MVTNHLGQYNLWRNRHNMSQIIEPDVCNQTLMHEFLVTYLRDMQRGYRNVHTRTTTNFLFANRYMRPPDFVAHLEKASAGWHVVRQHLHIPDSVVPREFPTSKNASEEENNFRDAFVNAFDDEVWGLFCEFFYQDFTCLGYEGPAECLAFWSNRPGPDHFDGARLRADAA